MTDFQTSIITLMKCAVTGETAQLPAGFSLEAAEEFAGKQNIVTLVYDGAVKCGISPDEPVMQRLFQRYVRLMLHSERQLAEIERIFHAFDENGIDYLPLKGCNMKKSYPRPELRYMGDADILIRTEQYDRIKPLMKELGFTEGRENEYEYHWRNTNLNVELHKQMVPSMSGYFYDYWGNTWRRAEKNSGSRYALTAEDDFLFQFTHFVKHYSGPGIGCRYLLDLWVFLCVTPELDHDYLQEELTRLRFSEFYGNIRKLLSVWFEGKETDECTDYITDFIFSGSSWGVWINAQVASVVKNAEQKKQNKLHLVLLKIFPPCSKMIYSYPFLKKAPWLLPFCWCVRIVDALFMDSSNRSKGIRLMKDASGGSIAQYKKHMQYVGLHFGEN